MLKLVTILLAINHSYGAVNNKKFPSDFMFGVATAAYQIEGGWNLDGKTESIWDNYTHLVPSKILDGSNGDITTDSYHLYETDVELLKELGVNHYRFSISWNRILPKAVGDEINELGVAYYKNLIKLLKQNQIEPVVTLFHWDLPQVLQDQGGFLNESFVDWYANYAEICFRTFGEDVKYWSTFNEPMMTCTLGYGLGLFPPGINSQGVGEYVCVNHLVRAHAAAWHVYDENFRESHGGKISLNFPISWYAPATNSSEDVEASERILQFVAGIYANPLYYGDYPDIVKESVANSSHQAGLNESRLPEFTEEQKAYLKGTLDFFALNTYNSTCVKSIPGNDAGIEITECDPSQEIGAWGIVPLLKWIQSTYEDPEIFITENGLPVHTNGTTESLEDDNRIATIEAYLSGIREAMDDNVKVFGYTVWSVIDNFEWTSGFTVKYGLYQVDFDSENKTRTAKKSAKWYRNVIATHCLTDNCEE